MKKLYISYILSYLVILLIIILCASCSVFKSGKSSTVDTSTVKRTDSVSVSKNETTTNKDEQWWREILNFRPHDSTYIERTNTVQPVYQIIREGGTVQTQTHQLNYDSIRINRLDSAMALFLQSQSTSKVKAFDFWQILALGIIGIIILYFVLSKVNFSLKK